VVRGGDGGHSLRATVAGPDRDDVWPELRAGSAAGGSVMSPDDRATLDEQVRSDQLGGEQPNGPMRLDRLGREQMDGPMDQGEPAQQAVEAPCLRAGVRVHEFFPEGYAGEKLDGAFLLDSFFYMKKENRKKTHDWYLPRLLKDLQTTTGLVFKAVCSGGAALIRPGDGGAFFGELLEHVPGGLSVTVAIVSGNDLLVNWKVPDLDSSVLRAAERLLVDLKAKSLLQYAVVGMSSSTWSYDRWMDADARARYDRNAVELASCFEAAGVRSSTGVAELRGVVVIFVHVIRPLWRMSVFVKSLFFHAATA